MPEDVDDAAEAGPPLEAPAELTLDILRHSAAHLMAAAVCDVFPGTRYDVGPSIEDGFFYNFLLPGDRHLTEADLATIEARMGEMAALRLPYRREVMDRALARGLFDAMGQSFKVAIIDRLADDVTSVAVYRTGDFVDLCRGPHVADSGQIRTVKLLRVAGVYWRGDERNPQLQRIYGTAWMTGEDSPPIWSGLPRPIAATIAASAASWRIFHFDASAPGMPYWLPNGVIVLNELIDFWRKDHRARGYHEVMTPLISEKALWETSGHWDHYRDDMFLIPVDEQTTYGLKPMNCPNAHVIYNLRRHSYRELPLRYSDIDPLHRFERSGTLHGLLQVRKFMQDDAHIFVTEEQIEEEYARILEITRLYYGIFKLEFSLRLGTRPDDFMGDVETWDRAESALLRILEGNAGTPFTVERGEGAFYGPKVDILMKDAIGRSWTDGTIRAGLPAAPAVRLRVHRRLRGSAHAGRHPSRHLRLAGALHRHPHRELRRLPAPLAGAGPGGDRARPGRRPRGRRPCPAGRRPPRTGRAPGRGERSPRGEDAGAHPRRGAAQGALRRRRRQARRRTRRRRRQPPRHQARWHREPHRDRPPRPSRRGGRHEAAGLVAPTAGLKLAHAAAPAPPRRHGH